MDKQKALEMALAQIEKALGKDKVFRLGDKRKVDVDVISTGSIGLDYALGVGGLPKGRIIEIYGSESSGKTTIAYHCIAECQKSGGIAAFIDAEQSVDPTYAKNLGVDIDQLYVSQPDTGEEALEIMDHLIRSGAFDLVVLDSVAALVPKAEIEGDMGDSHIGLQARLMSQALRKIGGSLNKSNTAAIFINQLREKVGIMFGNPEVTPGGRALKFWSTIRLESRRIETIKQGGEAVANRTKVKVVKNKVAPPFREVEFDIVFGKGISKSGEILDLAVKHDIVSKTGAWFNFGDIKLGQGRENVKIFFEENPEIMKDVENLLKAKLFTDESSIPVTKEESKE